MNIRKKAAVTVGATALAFAGVLGTAGQSFAGSNGQQLKFADARGDTYSILVVGKNQNGVEVSKCFYTPNQVTYISGYWWKGNIEYLGWSGDSCTGSTRGHYTAYVPTSQPNSDWYTITNG
ncbi:hypothetical protein [Streptomyces sp. NPDC000410]|uniref:hypothetical protein n=1 Tax=Streptomyces sp. NPDC000410 TaxID=3154254 RepID=UPI00331E432F